MTASLPPIWIISLTRSVDRRTIMAGHLALLGLPYEFVNAVDGRNLSEGEVAAVYSREETFRLLGRPLARGEIGCTLSHLHVCRRLIDSGLEEVVVLEDDVLLDPAVREVLERRNLLPEGWDLIHLHVGNPGRLPLVSIWGKRPLGGAYQSVRFTTPVDGSYAYLLRRSGAEKIFQHGYPVRLPADQYTGGSRRSDVHLSLYGIDPPVSSCWAAESTMPEAYALREELEARHRAGPLRAIYEALRERAARLYKRVHPFYRL
jgi:glycosyl transferase family 25